MKTLRSFPLVHAGLLLFTLVLAGGCKRTVSDKPIGAAVKIEVPLGLPSLRYPADNPPTAEAIVLGRRLFYEKGLSQGSLVSCASCHDPARGFADVSPASRGAAGKMGVRNAPTLLNAGYLPLQFWDGRAVSLEAQSLGPIADPNEMNLGHEISLASLESKPIYQTLFLQAFGPGGIIVARLQKALASFERTLLSGDSAFDRYQYGGDKGALTPGQVRGLEIFQDPNRGNCAACHTIGPKNALFTDGKFHNIGEGVGDEGSFGDIGRYHLTQVETDKGAFKTPTLRNVAITAPYMHDGGLKTLKEVVDFYAGGGNSNPYLDKQIRTIQLSGQDRTDLVDFLHSLTGTLPPNVGPPEAEKR